jgi:hypothetical protein
MEFSQPSARHVTIHYVFSQHARCPHYYPLKSSIYFFYRFSTANSIHVCNVLFVVECCEAITLVSTFKFSLKFVEIPVATRRVSSSNYI